MSKTSATGWAGTVAVVAAYLAVSYHVIPAGLTFQVLNLGGAIALGVFYWRKRVIPGLALNIFWAAVALGAIIR